MKKIVGLVMMVLVALTLSACMEDEPGDGYSTDVMSQDVVDEMETKDSYFLYYYSSTCSHCAAFAPTLKDYVEKEDAYPIYRFDNQNYKTVDFANAKLKEFGIQIQGTPTLVLIKDGEVAETLVGEQELEDIPVKGDTVASDDSKEEEKSAEEEVADGDDEADVEGVE